MAVNKTEDLIAWINTLNDSTYVKIEKNSLESLISWYYDEKTGGICNKTRSFFQICGLKKISAGKTILEQPIILQNEIGFLGIICKQINGEMHYLMQAKIEPGNINKIQISPTIQATKSNFTRKHGGRKPAYLDYFLNASKYKIIVDQIQSEQSSRFWKKRNRNIIIEIDEDIVVLPNYRWMTLAQIKELMTIDNLVNMDTRTVLSCIPCDKMQHMGYFSDEAFYQSVFEKTDSNIISQIYHYINNYKMFNDCLYKKVPLYSLDNWYMHNNEFVCKTPYSFKIVFCNIEIEGREVQRWTQPLFEATGIATFGLLTYKDNGIRKFIVKATPEVGCFDFIELGPSVQREHICLNPKTQIDMMFDEKLRSQSGIIFDTLLSEEGGRFYCEQNRNVIIEVNKEDVKRLPEGYFSVTYSDLNSLIQVNNCLNIQLRNLLSVMAW